MTLRDLNAVLSGARLDWPNPGAIHDNVGSEISLRAPLMRLSDIYRPSSVHPGAFLKWYAEEFDRVMAARGPPVVVSDYEATTNKTRVPQRSRHPR